MPDNVIMYIFIYDHHYHDGWRTGGRENESIRSSSSQPVPYIRFVFLKTIFLFVYSFIN